MRKRRSARLLLHVRKHGLRRASQAWPLLSVPMPSMPMVLACSKKGASISRKHFARPTEAVCTHAGLAMSIYFLKSCHDSYCTIEVGIEVPSTCVF